MKQIDYIIIEPNAMEEYTFDNLTKIEELSTPGHYEVYKNKKNHVLKLVPKNTFTGSDIIINFRSNGYNGSDFVGKSVYGREGDFAWTRGNEFKCQLLNYTTETDVNVTIKVYKVFNEIQRYKILSRKGNILAEGILKGPSIIKLVCPSEEDSIFFKIELPDAVRINDVHLYSKDSRMIALAIEEITISSIRND